MLQSVEGSARNRFEAVVNKMVADLGKKYKQIQDIFARGQYRDFEKAIGDVDALEMSGYEELLAICKSSHSGELLEPMVATDSCDAAIGTAIEGMLKETAASNLPGKDEFHRKFKDCGAMVKQAKTQYEVVYMNGGKLLGNMCIVQALKQDLQPGETRQGLARRCDKGFAKKRYLQCDPHMHLLLRRHLSDSDTVGDVQPGVAPPRPTCEVKVTPPSTACEVKVAPPSTAASGSDCAEASSSKRPLAEVDAPTPDDHPDAADAGAVKEKRVAAAVKDKVKRRATAPEK